MASPKAKLSSLFKRKPKQTPATLTPATATPGTVKTFPRKKPPGQLPQERAVVPTTEKGLNPLPPEHMMDYVTPEPNPAYRSRPLPALIRWLFLTSRREPKPPQKDARAFVKPPPHPLDQTGQPYIQDRVDVPISVLRVTHLLLFVGFILLAIKPNEFGDNKYRSGPSHFQTNLGEDPVHQSYHAFFWASFWLSLVAALFNLLLYIGLYFKLRTHTAGTYLALIPLNFFFLVCVAVNMVYPTTWRLIFGYICEIFILIAAGTAAHVAWHWALYDRTANDLRYSDCPRAPVDPLWANIVGWAGVHQLVQRLFIRRRLGELHAKGRTVFLLWTLVILLAVGINVSYEIFKMATSQSRLYPRQAIEETDTVAGLADFRRYESRVVMVVVDGLTLGALSSNPELATFVTSLGTDFRNFPMSASVPTAAPSNWAALMSGVSPENTGLLGSYVTPERIIDMPYDTIFREATSLGVDTFFAGHPNFRSMLGTDLTPLTGDAAVSGNVGTSGLGEHSTLAADTLRAELAQEALLRTTPPALIVVHLDNPSTAGSYYGLHDQEYNRALDFLASQLRQLKVIVDRLADTTMILTSSHGMSRERGHGGSSEPETDIPFVVYQPNSGLANLFWTAAGSSCGAFPSSRSNVDIAPTVAALLDLPVPRQAEGVILQELLPLLEEKAGTAAGVLPLYHLQDLFFQKREFVCSYVFNVLWGEDYDTCLSYYTGQTCLSGTDIAGATCDCLTNIYALRERLAGERAHSMRIYFWRNFFLTLGFLILLGLLLVCSADLYTFVDFRTMFRGPPHGQVEDSDDEDDYMQRLRPDPRIALLTTGGAPFRRPDYPRSHLGLLGAVPNRNALAAAFFLQAGYWVFGVLVFMIGYIIARWFFYAFGQSMINLHGDLLGWLAFCLVPGIIAAPVMYRLFKKDMYLRFPMTTVKRDNNNIAELLVGLFRRDVGAEDPGWILDPEPDGSTRELKLGAAKWVADSEPVIDTHVYLTKWYLIWASLATNLALLWLASGFTCFIPVMLSTPFVSAGNWSFRFVILSLQLLGLPLLLVTLLQVAKWAPFSPWEDLWDGVFELQAAKDMRRLRYAFDDVSRPGPKRAAHLHRAVGRRAEKLWGVWDTLHRVSGDVLEEDVSWGGPTKFGQEKASTMPFLPPGLAELPRPRPTLLPQQQALAPSPANFPAADSIVATSVGRNGPAEPAPLQKRDRYYEGPTAALLPGDERPYLPSPASEGRGWA